MAPLLGLAWAVLLLAAAWAHRPPRVRRLAPAVPRPGALRHRTPPLERGPSAAIGRVVAALARPVVRSVVAASGAHAPRHPARPPPAASGAHALRHPARPPPAAARPPPGAAPGEARRLGRAVLAGAVVAAVVPALAPLAAAGVWCGPALGRRRAARRREADVLRSLPEVVDLLVLTAGAGLTVPLAVGAVARRGSGSVAEALGRARREADLGRRLADALDELPASLGEPVRPLVAALVASDRYGAPLLDRLSRLAAEARADRRRRAEAAARRVPVKLLFPLVCCTLPAFGLLTVAPFLAGALSSLRP